MTYFNMPIVATLNTLSRLVVGTSGHFSHFPMKCYGRDVCLSRLINGDGIRISCIQSATEIGMLHAIVTAPIYRHCAFLAYVQNLSVSV